MRTARRMSAAKRARPDHLLAAIGVLAHVGAVPEELVDQVAVGAVQLDGVEAQRLGVGGAASAKARMASATSSSVIGSPNFLSGPERPEGLS